jgi:predicted metal-dependent HD superfamily phosphohydrolase
MTDFLPALRQRWTMTWNRLARPAPAPLFDELAARYSEPQRRYHTLQHLDECFTRLDELRADMCDAAAVELALWFHDAVYDVRRGDNEARSADWAAACLADAGVPAVLIGKVQALIMATCRHDAAGDPDTMALVDADLAILGMAGARFLEYEAQIRAEYAHVPDPVFTSKRRDVLAHFLLRPAIFATRTFALRYEEQARDNLAAALQRLSG